MALKTAVTKERLNRSYIWCDAAEPTDSFKFKLQKSLKRHPKPKIRRVSLMMEWTSNSLCCFFLHRNVCEMCNLECKPLKVLSGFFPFSHIWRVNHWSLLFFILYCSIYCCSLLLLFFFSCWKSFLAKEAINLHL